MELAPGAKKAGPADACLMHPPVAPKTDTGLSSSIHTARCLGKREGCAGQEPRAASPDPPTEKALIASDRRGAAFSNAKVLPSKDRKRIPPV